jgi:hypothetical protein
VWCLDYQRVGTVTNTTTVKSTGQPYSAAAHRTLIAMWCAKNHGPFNSVLDEDYQAEVEMLRPEPFSLVLRQSHMISNLSMPKCQRMSGIISW